jgi:hypothetical protein
VAKVLSPVLPNTGREGHKIIRFYSSNAFLQVRPHFQSLLAVLQSGCEQGLGTGPEMKHLSRLAFFSLIGPER